MIITQNQSIISHLYGKGIFDLLGNFLSEK